MYRIQIYIFTYKNSLKQGASQKTKNKTQLSCFKGLHSTHWKCEATLTSETVQENAASGRAEYQVPTDLGKTIGMEVSKTYFSALSLLQVLEPFSNKTPPNTTQLEVLPDVLWVERT